MKRAIFIILGCITFTLAIIGVVVPGLPTTPFLLLTAALFARSSKRLLTMLHSNKFLSRYITEYNRRKGMTIRQKVFAISFMWCMVLISVLHRIEQLWIDCLIVGVAIIGTVVMGFIVKTYKED